MRTLAFLMLAACGSTADPSPAPSTSGAIEDNSAVATIDLRDVWAKLCTDGPAVNDCLRDCIKHHDRPWCGRFDADCKADKGLDAELCGEWSRRDAQ